MARTFLAGNALVVSLLATGCSLSPLAKHAVAFSKATGTVINSSEDAYRAAMRLRQEEQVVAAVYAYDSDPHWSPYKDRKPLLSPEQLDARIETLDALKAYAASLVELTDGKRSKDLDTGAAAAGANLRGLDQSIATLFSTAAPSLPVVSTESANGVSTAIRALADYLAARKIKGSLPKVTKEMNGNVQALCELLNSDAAILRRQADVDYQELLVAEDRFIRSSALSAIQHREEVGKLVKIASQQQANDALLAKLQTALHTLELTHQALAAAAQGNNPEAIGQKIAELEAAGEDLGNFYKSLPTS